jgi:prevent-host-death family protein
MTAVASRDLRNHTAEVLKRVAAGDRVTITVNGAPVAELGPVRASRRMSMNRQEQLAILTQAQADPALRQELATLVPETTDDLGPIG